MSGDRDCIHVNGEYSVKWSCGQDVKDQIYDRVMAYFLKHESFHGESIHQMDEPIIDAPSVMSDIADNILKFEVTYKD